MAGSNAPKPFKRGDRVVIRDMASVFDNCAGVVTTVAASSADLRVKIEGETYPFDFAQVHHAPSD